MSNLRFLSPPIFEEDVEKTRIAGILNVILWAILVAGVVVAIFGGEVGFPLGTASALAIVILLVAVRRGYVRVAAIGVSVMTLIVPTLAIYMDGTLRTANASFYIVAVVGAGLLAGRRALLTFWALSAVAIGGVFLAEHAGYLASLKPPTMGSGIPVLVVFLTSLTLVTVLLWLTLHTLGRASSKATKRKAALIKSNQELQAIRDSLEQQVSERTRTAEEAREAAEAANRALEEQMWHVAGQDQLSETMRGDLDIPTLAARVIQQLCRYLDAQAGALFILRDDVLDLAGQYALPKGYDQRFLLGEGLVGQTAQDRQRRQLHDVPDCTFALATGLGEVTLRHLLFEPFIYEGQVGGVELGKLTPFTPAEVTFVEQAARRIALAFHIAQSRARIDALLTETQAQEEELRAINEELHAQAGALREHAQRETRATDVR